ncbi:zf-HC2 domain-containing protein [Streptomyces sp. NBC_01187]|uniref:zf-HC2 domain-containing protein n=1 Tax=Streptomyces sp. NBC_01187 TaxID=2903766 RepID=UPI0038709B39|nr:zf-HC2 domain-containing protein [Streptomyces sp. NBC_01187]
MSAPQAPGPPGDPGSPGGPSSPSGPGDPGGPSGPGGPGDSAGALDHKVLKSLLGAWALAACSAEETAAVEAHLTDCAACADEALRLRDAVGLLHAEDSLDLDPMLRSRVLEGCLGRRPARIPVPEWAAPYDAEAARLDALLRDMADEEWRAPVRLRWFDGEREAERETTVAGVIGHLLAVDGLVATALGLPDPLPPGALGAEAGPGPMGRTEVFWALGTEHRTPATREPWRRQSHAMVRHVSFAADAEGGGSPGAPTGAGPIATRQISYGDFTLPLHDAFLDRAFECWMHAEDIAEAVDYPYGPPGPAHLNLLVDLAARQLPGTIAVRRRMGLAAPPRRLGAAGAPGRTLHLEVEGQGGGDWYIPLDSPGAGASPEGKVAHVALDGLEFCQLAAGHVPPLEAAAGQDGDREAIRDVLFAVASLSRL